jgi:hypothetical protein
MPPIMAMFLQHGHMPPAIIGLSDFSAIGSACARCMPIQLMLPACAVVAVCCVLPPPHIWAKAVPPKARVTVLARRIVRMIKLP